LNKIDPWELAALGESLEGKIPLCRMPRLTSLLSSPEGQVDFRLQAGIDDQNIYFIVGHGKTRIEMICQRCMQTMTLPLVVGFRLGLVHSRDEAVGLADEYEPLVAPPDGVSVSGLLEDELILTLPLVARHEDIRQCQSHGFALPDTAAPETIKPFANLATLLQDSKTRSD
jgi:uncharacterized protein